MKYYLIKIVTESTRASEDDFPRVKHHREFDGAVDTIEEATRWAESVHVEGSVTPYAIKGEEVHFEIRQKVKVETKATAKEKVDDTAFLIEQLDKK